MKRKKNGREEIIRKVREAEAMEASGQSLGQVCQKFEVIRVSAETRARSALVRGCARLSLLA